MPEVPADSLLDYTMMRHAEPALPKLSQSNIPDQQKMRE
jgi:hypothetical protein